MTKALARGHPPEPCLDAAEGLLQRGNALRLLVDVNAIAYEVGFGDLSNFNHAFRRAYAATPSDVRETARKEG